MKTCPKCQNKYTDDSLQFCLQDGTLLTGETSGISNLETVAYEEQEPETVVRKEHPQRVVKIEAPVEEPVPTTNPSFDRAPETTNSNTLRTMLLSVFGTALLFMVAAAGIWFYLNWGKSSLSRNGTETNINNASPTPKEPTTDVHKDAKAGKKQKPVSETHRVAKGC